MDNNFFDLPAEDVAEVKSALEGEAIRLPFTAPVLWWMNGNAKLKRDGSSPYFGGWASNSDEFTAAADEFGGVPPIFSPFTLTSDKNTDFDVFCTRAIGFAVIAKRSRWIIDEQSQHGRGHSQYLGIMSFMDEQKKFVPWGPVVLSAKGMSAKYLGDALTKFERATSKARRESANNLPAWFFYAILGTFGAAPVVQMVGKGSSQSPITPCDVMTPEEIKVDHLRAAYVGKDQASRMAELRRQSKEWLEAWRENKSQGVPTERTPEQAMSELGF
jgi:hypothetical protein